MRRLTLTTLFTLLLAACATPTGAPKDVSDEKDPDGLTCTTDREVGDPSDPAKICRGY